MNAMKKKYMQPYAEISRFGAADILLASDGITFINDDTGWLMGRFETPSAQNSTSGEYFG